MRLSYVIKKKYVNIVYYVKVFYSSLYFVSTSYIYYIFVNVTDKIPKYQVVKDFFDLTIEISS